jgi:hypothetical protein
MAGILTVDTIQSDSSYASTLNVASKINFTSGMQIGGQDTTFGGMRNRIINGDMRIDQRNAGALVSSASGYIVDRWSDGRYAPSGGVYSARQVTDAPTGFSNSLIHTVTTAVAGTYAGDFYQIWQTIEGNNVADFNLGTASAVTFTASFWVKSSVTGTYSIAFGNEDPLSNGTTRTYVTTYVINTANTWEYKTITVAGDTTGNWGKTNGDGLAIYFDLGCGTDTQITANSWQSANGRRIAGTVKLIATVGATFQVTGVQLEKGSVASAFENRQYGTELALCQRYYETTYPVGYSAGYNFGGGYPFSTSKPVTVNFIASDDTTTSQSVRFVVAKRTNPTVVIYSASDGASGFTFTYKATGGSSLNVAANVTYTSENLCNINQSLSAVNQTNESYFHFTASAEL